jgi:HlyD family secretion protein
MRVGPFLFAPAPRVRVTFESGCRNRCGKGGPAEPLGTAKPRRNNSKHTPTRAMKRATKITAGVIVLIVVAGATAALMTSGNGEDPNALPTVEVVRGDIVDKALAVGTITPRVEVSVKSQVPGVLKHLFADVGDYVRAGSPLMEIQPNPTPRELVDAERQIELRQIEVENLRLIYDRQKALREKDLIAESDFELARRNFEQADLQVRMASEQLALLRDGRVATDKGDIETLVRAPVSGFIIDKMAEIGDPIVPLTSYQEGTVLMTMADMNDLIFKGTVDEIDVGRLKEGMSVKIKVGALPDANVNGVLSKIWLKARKEENATIFPVEIEITEATRVDPAHPEADPVPVVLRAGYSSNADVIIEQREDVLMIPERVVEFAGDTARVKVVTESGEVEDRTVTTGLSDAINIEVIAGLEEGSMIQEKPVKVIE